MIRIILYPLIAVVYIVYAISVILDTIGTTGANFTEYWLVRLKNRISHANKP